MLVRSDITKSDFDAGAFHRAVERQVEGCRQRWWSASTDLPDLGDEVSWGRKRQNEARIDEFAASMEGELEQIPSEASERERWSRGLREDVRRIMADVLALSPTEQSLILSEDYFEATAEFTRRARAFDPNLRLGDLSQALRNVWIMHLFQRFLDRPVVCTDSIVAYSLLYPYTDNLLDDPQLSREAKGRFNRWLSRRLAGEEVAPENDHAAAIDRLVGLIEGEYSRTTHPEVFESLLAIHRAQGHSLDQHARKPRSPYEVDLLGISLCKGGTSVLADGWLVAGKLTPEEEEFCFAFGAFLQLADDLQDLRHDLRANHQTLFSHSARHSFLDALANRLVHFLDGVFAAPRFSAARFDPLKSLVRRSCLQLVFQSVGFHRGYFRTRYLNRLEKHSVVRFATLRKKTRTFLERYRHLDDRISSETSFASLLDTFAPTASPV